MKNKTKADLSAEIERLQHRIDEMEAMNSESEKNQKQAVSEEELTTLKSVLNGIEDIIYVSDPETYELLHVNDAFIRIWGDGVLSKKCFHVIQGRDAPCPFCTNERIFGENLGKTYVWEFQNETNGNWYRCADRAIEWLDGRKVRFELASDITHLKQTEQALREQQSTLEEQVRERTAKLNEELDERKKAEKALRENRAVIRNKLKAIIEPDSDMDLFGLADILDFEELQPIMEDFSRITGLANAIIDTSGNILMGAGWQDICTKFHRLHNETLNNCIESDTKLSEGIEPGTFKAYRCKNNLWDIATPITLSGRHVGNVFVGQYFLADDQLDMDFFRNQAQRYNFNEEDYLAALDLVPRVDRKTLDEIMRFLSKFAGLISSMSLNAIRLARTITKRKQAEKVLALKSQTTSASNRILREALICETEGALAQSALRLIEDLTHSKFGFIGEINSSGRFDTIGISNPGWETCEIEGSKATLLIKDMPLRGIWATVLKAGTAQTVNDPSVHPERVGIPRGHPELSSFLGVPLFNENRAVGMIALANKEGGYDETDKEVVEALAASLYEALIRKRLELQVRAQARIKEAQAEIAIEMAGDPSIEPLCEKILSFICDRLQAPTGLMYVADEQGTLKLAGSYAHQRRQGQIYEYRPGEGLVGQAALAKQVLVLDDVPKEYFTIASGLGEMLPRVVFIKPILREDRVRAVLEFGFMQKPEGDQATLLAALNDSIAAAIESAQARASQARLLTESQTMSEELQVQQEELKTSNEELEEQTRLLKRSEEKLKVQQEELQASNEELEEKNEMLTRQAKEMERAREDIQAKAEELALASKYKSEFLANMSHELRTPLNSLLLLAQTLADNKEDNLTTEQVEFAKIIYSGGSDLLNLINEILDLAKIEAGRIKLRIERVEVTGLAEDIRVSFGQMAGQKGLELLVEIQPDAPADLISDRNRIGQILKNLVSNAIKFSESGRVSVTFGRPPAVKDLSEVGISGSDCLAVAVEDTGIGIDPVDQKVIFEAFQQVDGSTSRRYGGTGLGLSISRELASLLGGTIVLNSEPGKGSIFTLYLPLEQQRKSKPVKAEPAVQAADLPPSREIRPALKPAESITHIEDDREKLAEGDRTILIIEDDAKFARILYGKCHDKGFKCLAAPTGEDGLELAERYLPDAVILDLQLPGLDGWAVLDALKGNTRTRHIPVHIMSVESASGESLRKGAVGHATKPIDAQELEKAFARLEEISTQKTKRVMVVEDDEDIRRSTVALIGDTEVEVVEVATGKQAMEALRSGHYDCMVLDLGLPDMGGREMLEMLCKEGVELPPVIVHTARDVTPEEEAVLRESAESIIIKDVRSQERLLDEVSLFLHRMVSKMPARKRQIIRNLHESDALLVDKKVLVVDDDMRTTFAVSALLAEVGMKPIKAQNGQKALAILEEQPDVDLVLMDIMMPVLDGYQTMEKIRSQNKFSGLPIIALTAKAMPVDREKCLAAGANDYLPKPVDRAKLISMIRVWLYR